MTRERSPRLAPRGQAISRSYTAEHLDVAPGYVVDRLMDALQEEGAPRWIGQVVSGIFDFDADTFGEIEALALLREDCRRTARLLSTLSFEQERRLEEARTGRLIRMVLQTDEAAGFCLSVVPGEHITSFVFEINPDTARTTVAQADRVLVDLVDSLRRKLGLNSLNPGGLANFRERRPAADGDPRASPASRAEPAPATAGDPRGPLFDSVRSAVGSESLHWAARARGREIVFSVDQFEHPELVRQFRVMGIDARRKFYRDLATDALALTNRVGRVVRSLLGGPVRRIVLDVEQGAVVIHRLGPEDHLLGVTLSQEMVGETEATLTEIAAVHTVA